MPLLEPPVKARGAAPDREPTHFPAPDQGAFAGTPVTHAPAPDRPPPVLLPPELPRPVKP